jgi:1-deoxy-D-xylulose-5-phosphate reductoisomerase
LLKQAIAFNVKNLILTRKRNYESLKEKTKYSNIKVFNDFTQLNRIFKKKIDYIMCSISGIDGLYPTCKAIKFTKKIAIANKESIICGWNLIEDELKKNKTEFIPVDSEHFSIWYGLKNLKENKLEKVFLTASGGPFYKTPLNKFKSIKISDAINHPNWKMGKKISTDSATMINKVYEVIEAKKIFDIPYKKIKILIHPKSYIHAILKFNNGLTNIVVHDTSMKVPIFNTLFLDTNRQLITKKINTKILNNLDLSNVNLTRYPMVRLLNFLPNKHSLFETVIVASNDKLVELFLNNKIKFIDIQKRLFKIIKKKEFQKFKNISPKKITDITNLNNYVCSKIDKNNI